MDLKVRPAADPRRGTGRGSKTMLLPVLLGLLLAAGVGGSSGGGISSSRPGASSRRHVRWYMASGAEIDVDVNNAFLSDPARRRAITGAYACCNFWMVNATTGGESTRKPYTTNLISGGISDVLRVVRTTEYPALPTPTSAQLDLFPGGVFDTCSCVPSHSALIGDTAGNYSHRFGPFLSRNMTVHAHGMLNEVALKSGAAMSAIPALAEFVTHNGQPWFCFDTLKQKKTFSHAHHLWSHWTSYRKLKNPSFSV